MQTVALPSVPVVIGADRFAAADRFLREHPNLKPTHWLLDDGGQHRQLTRDVNIFLVDAARPFGSGAGAILPAGSLREPKTALKRADLVIATRCDENHPNAADLASLERLVGRPPLKAYFRESFPERSVDGGEVFDLARHSPAFLATGIAGGDRLAKSLKAQLGLVLAGTYARPDHENLVKAELLAGLGAARAVLTTAKDYWRDPAVFDDLPVPAFVLPLAVEWSEEELAKALSPWL